MSQKSLERMAERDLVEETVKDYITEHSGFGPKIIKIKKCVLGPGEYEGKHFPERVAVVEAELIWDSRCVFYKRYGLLKNNGKWEVRKIGELWRG
jgi:hypothetical protein